MRKLLLVVIVLFVFAARVAGQTGEAKPKSQDPAQITITFNLPEGWHENTSDPTVILISTTEVDWLGEETPPAPHPWLIIVAASDELCDYLPSKWPIFGFAKGKAEARLCRKGAAMLLGYYDRDREKDRHVREMLEIAESIRHAAPLKQ